jgi:hypothetical protein
MVHSPASSKPFPLKPLVIVAVVVGLGAIAFTYTAGWLTPDIRLRLAAPDAFPHAGANAVSVGLGQVILFSAFAATTTSIAVVRQLEFPCGHQAVNCGSLRDWPHTSFQRVS